MLKTVNFYVLLKSEKLHEKCNKSQINFLQMLPGI